MWSLNSTMRRNILSDTRKNDRVAATARWSDSFGFEKGGRCVFPPYMHPCLYIGHRLLIDMLLKPYSMMGWFSDGRSCCSVKCEHKFSLVFLSSSFCICHWAERLSFNWEKMLTNWFSRWFSATTPTKVGARQKKKHPSIPIMCLFTLRLQSLNSHPTSTTDQELYISHPYQAEINNSHTSICI